MIRYRKHTIPQDTSIHQALVILNDIKDTLMTLFVLNDQEQMIGAITDGDIRRGLISNFTLEHTVDKVMNRNFKFLRQGEYDLEKFHQYRNEKIELLPILSNDDKITNFINVSTLKSILPLDAVIMAGGEGVRLRPLTEHTPKPLLEVGGKPIIEHNIDRLAKYGVQDITITLRYLGEKIESYFGNGLAKDIRIGYVREENKLGTLGAIMLVEHFHHDTILVMNSDLLTNIDYEDFYLHFKNQDADMLIASMPYQVSIPYAVLDTHDGAVTSFMEKPTYTYHTNAGIYLIKKEHLAYIPKGDYFDATDFIKALIDDGKKVQTYPMLNYWLDIGKHEDYKKAQEDIKYLQF